MPGFSTITGDESIMFADNVSFDGTYRSGKITTDGQLLIGSTASPHIRVSTLTAGAGMAITNGSGSITLSSFGGGYAWTNAVNASYTLVTQNGYITDRAGGVTYTLPLTASIGESFIVVGNTGIATIAQNAGQQIFIGNLATTAGVAGSLTATDAGDCVSLVCIGTNMFRTFSIVGNWIVA